MLGTRQISRRCEDLIYQSRWLETSWVILTRWFIGYSEGAKVLFRIGKSCSVSLHMSILNTWWRNQMETYFALLDLCVGHSPVVGEFPSQRPMMRSFDVFCRLHPHKRLSKQLIRRWFEVSWRSLKRHCNGVPVCYIRKTGIRRYWTWIVPRTKH